MSGRKASGRLLALLGASTTMIIGTIACGPRADDINQVQPGYVRKQIFETDHEWYYRRTVVKSETTNAYIIEGSGDLPLERVKWRVEEKTLVAYKPYDAIPGTGTGEYEGAPEVQGSILAAFPIDSHFDIQRGYDAVTGTETNIISENSSDRPWTEREYMRIDWSTELISTGYYGSADNVYEFPVSLVATKTYWSDLDTRPTDVYASRFQDDYVEVTHNAFIGMDLITCMSFLGWSSGAWGGCGYGEAKIRHSFARVESPSDYVPRNYPDSVVRKDESGNAISDPATGEVLREPIYNRFGVFRREIPTFDRGYGITESGKIYRAMIFNIWKRHTDDAGNEIPCNLERCDREPKPIIYYMNAEFPERWRKAARETGAEYDRVYKGMVTDLVGASRTPEHMFEIRDNDCNVANVKSFVSNNVDLTYAVARAVCSEGEACDKPLDKVAFGNLMSVCTSLEAATRDPATGKSEFTWQREGDARYNMLVYLNNPQRSGWGGYGPMHSDSRTGETVSATAWIRGHYYELTASTIVDYIELINDEKTVDEIIYGQDIRKHIAAVNKRGADIAKRNPSSEFTSMMQQRLERFGSTKEDMLRPVPAGHQLARIRRAQGTQVEEALVNDYQLMMASGGMWKPGQEVTDELYELAGPMGRVTQGNPMSAMRKHARAALGNAGFCFLSYEFDPQWYGLAIALKNLPREDRYQIIAEKLLKHVFLHEIGHNVGLSHNFEGTYDALNYDDRFWNTFIGGTEDDKLFERVEEYRHTTVMEYIGQGKAAFGDFLGKYDEAAIRFAYANQVQVFTGAAKDEASAGGETLRQWRYANEYTDIADHLCDNNWPSRDAAGCSSDEDRRAVLASRDWVDFDPQSPPANEVPYLFCDNTYEGLTPFCSTFDYGSNLKEIFQNYYTRWAVYFFFNNFQRDRLYPYGWQLNAALYPAFDALLFVSVVGQYLYFMQANDPQFVTKPLGKDMQAVVARGLNMAAEIMSTPEPVRMCKWPGATNPTIYIPHGYFDGGCDQYAPIESEYAVGLEAIQPPLGDARPTSIGFTDDYEDYDVAWVGSYFDKSNVMWLLGLNSPTYLRYNYDIDYRTYSIGLFRLFEPEIRTFYDKMVNLDPYLIEQDTAKDLGSYWCRNPDAMDVAHLGYFESRRMLDDQSTTNPSLPGPSTGCANPAVIYPALLSNMPFEAMYWAHAAFSSDFDSELNMGKSLKIYVRGSYDDYPSWNDIPSDEICTTTDILTGLEYRAVRQPPGIPDLGCRLILKADDAQTDYLANDEVPFYKDRWRAWFERLEFARDLARVYGDVVILR